MPGSGPSALFGLAIGAYGKKPKVPSLNAINPNVVQGETVKSNIASFADIASLATGVNTFNQSQLETMQGRALPGGAQKIRDVIMSRLMGQIPDDVRSAIVRGNSERYAGPFSGSPFSRLQEAKQLGLSSLGEIDKGFNSTMQWMAASTAPAFNYGSMFFTPQDRLGFSERQQAMNWQQALMKSEVKAAPDPWRVALAQGFDADVNNMISAGGILGGAAASGAAGAAGGGGGMSY